MGLGMNFWFNEYFGVNVQGSYDYMFDFNDYMHYSGGVVVRFGKMIDKDKDQIPNKYDACPDVFGVEMFQGCPDYDGDGVVDSLDACPKLYGAIESAGCPDQDKDGIPDPKDECPCDAGPAEYHGCPDSDGDGVLDKDDMCPDQVGTIATFGCPDRDGDGIADLFDGCPDKPGPKSNGGCPVVKAQQATIAPVVSGNLMDEHEQNIEFDLNSSKILKSSMKSLEEIFKIMQQDPGANYIINGYTDNTGPEDYNKYLSTERANAVKAYFVKKGVDENRLEAFGRGASDPISTNNTPEGRALNRRVEIEEK
jgi:outer membrane protein OmpA-like peptidoglycan-associated protein